jgi:hypothetical protein
MTRLGRFPFSMGAASGYYVETPSLGTKLLRTGGPGAGDPHGPGVTHEVKSA